MNKKMSDPAAPDRCHPGPDQDPGLQEWWNGSHKSYRKMTEHWNKRSQYVCGFFDETQMLDWFPHKGFKMMIDYNKERDERMPTWERRVAVYTINANKVRKGKRQVMFRKIDATSVEYIDLKKFA